MSRGFRASSTAPTAAVGVILDWVPAHFPTDAHGLSHFDGTALYEHEDPRQGFHPDWNTAIYNFGRREVSSFLVNNALFWPERYHIDGIRVDAVASMLYRDYSRKDGEWVPNEQGGARIGRRSSSSARSTARSMASIPASSPSPKSPHRLAGRLGPAHDGGLGFGFKWNMGFMHDTLQYMAREPVHRRHHHGEILFGLHYALTRISSCRSAMTKWSTARAAC